MLVGLEIEQKRQLWFHTVTLKWHTFLTDYFNMMYNLSTPPPTTPPPPEKKNCFFNHSESIRMLNLHESNGFSGRGLQNAHWVSSIHASPSSPQSERFLSLTGRVRMLMRSKVASLVPMEERSHWSAHLPVKGGCRWVRRMQEGSGQM